MKISIGITFHSYSLITKGEFKGPQDSSFLAINAKGGESIRPKAKGLHHHIFKIQKIFHKKEEIISIGIIILIGISFGFKNSISIISSDIYFKNPLDKLRGEFLEGELLFSQRKTHLKQGEKFQILKMLLKIIFLYLWLFAKEFENTSPKGLQKEASSAIVVQNVK
jgi:hypothetical protein